MTIQLKQTPPKYSTWRILFLVFNYFSNDMIYAEASLNKSDVILENEVAKLMENEVAKIMSSPMNLLMTTTLNFRTNSSYTRLMLLLSFQC